MISGPTWKAIAAETQADLAAKIPQEWLLPEQIKESDQKDVSKVAETCGILDERELEITKSDATTILRKIHSKDWSSEQVTRAFCKRSAIAHQLVNCLMEINFEDALQEARQLDKSFQESGKLKGPLHGLPISIKDHIHVKGMRSPVAYCGLVDNIAKDDSVVVKALKGAGAIVFVKTTMPVTGMVLETVSNLYGRTLNPFNRLLGAGGSSGGEGSLIGMFGSPLGIGTDIGGSIRIPAAFNGIYGIRPSTRRLSYAGVSANGRGQIAIGGTMGPMGRSIADLELACKVITDAQPWYQDPSVLNKEWLPRPSVPEQLTFGIMRFDGVVMPHPPILRYLDEAVNKLKAAGHEVIEFEPHEHERCWEIAYPLYYSTSGREMQQLLDKTEEPWPAAAKKLSASVFVKQERSVQELFSYHAARDDYRMAYLKHWNGTAEKTKSGKPIDVLICPISPCAGYPHDFLPWWGYGSQWNLLDYPGVIIPVGSVDSSMDVKDMNYKPINERDQENYEIYDPNFWHNAPVSLQLIGRQLEDEKLLAISAVVDQVLNSRPK